MNEIKASMEKPVSHGAAESKPAAITTFVQVDTDTFRDIVQRLTGPSSSNSNEKHQVVSGKKPTSKLHERRQYYSRPKLEIVKPPCNFHFQTIMDRRRQCCSPSSFVQSPSRSPVSTPSATFSKLSILEQEKYKDSQLNITEQEEQEEEEKAIKEWRFYLHPSPRSNPGFTEPKLHALFPLTSPRTSDQPPA